MNSNILLRIVDITKYYQYGTHVNKAVDGVSLDIFKGEIISLLGVNGAGKTTLSSILATLHPASSGDILLDGRSIYENLGVYRHMIGYCPQNINLDKDITVEQNLFWAGRFMGLSDNVIHERRESLIVDFHLEQYRDQGPEVLSGGYARRVLIARALMHSPRLLILDEPTVGLDPHVRRQLWEAIRLLKDQGVTIILTTHYLDEAEVLSDRVCILSKGRVRLIDTPQGMLIAYQKSRLEDVFVHLIDQEKE